MSYPRNIYEQKCWTHEVPTRRNFESTKYPGEKISDSPYTQEKKFRTQETSTKKSLEATKYPQEMFWIHEIPTRNKFWTHEIPTRKNFGPTEKQWCDDTRPTRPTMAQYPRNLAHSQ